MEGELRRLNPTHLGAPQRRGREPHEERQQQGQFCHDFHLHHHQQNGDMYSMYIAKNNLGAIMLREKRYYDAANYFCQAMKYVNEQGSGHDTADSNELDSPSRNFDDARLDRNPRRTSRSSTSATHNTTISSSNSSPSTWAIESNRESFRITIGYFYLLVEGDNENNRNINNSTLHECPHSDRNVCNDGRIRKNEMESSSISEFENNNSEGTFVFRNPIIVVERDSANMVGNMFYPFLIDSTTIGINGHSTDTRSASPLSDSSAVRSRATTSVINKDDCVKLSSICAYNIALTYHLAVLDGGNNRQKETKNCGFETKESNNKQDNDTNAMHCRGCFAGEMDDTLDASRGTYLERPSKRQRRTNDNHCIKRNKNFSANSTTNIRKTPFGDCRCPFRKKIENKTKSTGSGGHRTNDRRLLCRALAYYEIAYRTLVSEHRVSFSQAMVILNNIGHIHRLIGSEENAKACFQRLLTTMMYLQLTGDSQQISHWNSFLTNVIDLVIPPTFSHKRYAPAA